MQGEGEIMLRTRVARQVTLARKRYRLRVMVQIIDNGPGIPEDIRDRIFYPAGVGPRGRHGLGLTLAQNFVSQHQRHDRVRQRAGRTCFTMLLPLA